MRKFLLLCLTALALLMAGPRTSSAAAINAGAIKSAADHVQLVEPTRWYVVRRYRYRHYRRHIYRYHYRRHYRHHYYRRFW